MYGVQDQVGSRLYARTLYSQVCQRRIQGTPRGVFSRREKALLPETQARIARELKVVELREERKKIVEQLNEMDEKIREMANGQPTDAEKKQFTRACPADCRGFLSTAWVCGLCSTHVCSKCHEIKDSKTVAKGGKPHTCLKENVETALS